MKKLFLLAMIALASVGINAQTVKGEGSLMGNIGYQTNYERFGLGVQGRYAIANNLRIAPDVTFYFPKDKVTGLDVSVNFHYVFNFKERRPRIFGLSPCRHRHAEQLLWQKEC